MLSSSQHREGKSRIFNGVHEITETRGGVRKADIAEVTYASHRIKGASKPVGAIGLAGVCERLEDACRSSDWETMTL
jgi:HPt (histidine-containing phosphotransfer) domain-containing protein